MPQTRNARFGLACGIGAQAIWGLFPIYLNILKPHIPPQEIVAHRCVWSFLLLAGLFGASRFFATAPWLPDPDDLAGAFKDKKTVLRFALAACLIATNWLVFVWAVSHKKTLDASLGYYICPQVVVLLGVVFLRESLSAIQWTAIFLAFGGVAFMLGSTSGVSSIAVLVALSFGFYALLKKQTKLPALAGLTCETGILLTPAIAFFVWQLWFGNGRVFLDSWWMNLLLLGLGPATIAPLALYATALKHIKLSTAGLLQFLGPSIQFAVGIFLFGEPFDSTRMVGFLIVWFGVVLYLYAQQATLSEVPALNRK